MAATAAQIDALILATASQQWQKVAMVLAKAAGRLEDAPHELIAARIGELVASRRLVSRGDIADWRGSEIRLDG